MKIVGNWALGVTVFYGGFALFMLGFLVVSTFHKVDLVEENYYDKEIAYQQHIDKVRRAKALTQPLEWKRGVNNLEFQFPKEFPSVEGKIKLYRPSDSGRDVIVAIKTDAERRQEVSLAGLERGLWRMQIDWKSGSQTYYNDDIFYLE